ncbi:glycosyltransferase family 2 protein [Desulfovibrio ferrophilus]|uniref:Glycosyl transferase family 2 n=1 Tax=Desulfovibrio ferrophilus TaxID=241368 RepID=A0A2Z6B1D5_9BACT|nr:glycosyltransferase [Desulfovibrio ferrophilus]BBD09294.1 glycosyl transferase family 2 [Desulfovibrio ferrophilus]
MFLDYMKVMTGGLAGQLERQTNAEVYQRLQNYICSFALEPIVISCYINRLLMNEKAFDQDAAYWAKYILGKFLQRRPFERKALEIGVLFFPEGKVPQLKAMVERTDISQAEWQSFSEADADFDEREQSRRELAMMLKNNPSSLGVASMLLEYCRRDALDPKRYLTAFRPPEEVLAEWKSALFQHYAQIGRDDIAMKLWGELSTGSLNETELNLAAELFIRAGQLGRGIAFYERSLALDPLQTPVRLRVKELRNPFVPDHELIEKRKVCIYLYTWNKATIFEQTLDSLSKTRLGNAKIKVLINGCTDRSLEVAKAAREKFPNNDFEIIETPINIGAPAARNWLINHGDTWESDYVAFLDDDVTIQEDWLDHFLTVMESDSGIGVVGAKIVAPGSPVKLQYLFRHVDVATETMLKMSLESPIGEYDTGLYNIVREARSVMGCQHMFRVDALKQVPQFDIQFSPSQVDDIEHDLMLCLKGFKIMYTGHVSCIHHQSSGVGQNASSLTMKKMGNAIGNDLKLCFKHFENLGKLAKMDSLSLVGPLEGLQVGAARAS